MSNCFRPGACILSCLLFWQIVQEERTNPKNDKNMTSYQRLYNYVLWLLTRRDYSRQELRQKMQLRIKAWEARPGFCRGPDNQQDIESVLQEVQRLGYLKSDLELTEVIAEHWHRQKKSQRYIEQKLRQKGLSLSLLQKVDDSQDLELNKAISVLQKQWPKELKKIQKWLTKNKMTSLFQRQQKLRQNLTRFLQMRGFQNEIVRKAIQALESQGVYHNMEL